MKNKILLIFGSSRGDGNTRRIVNRLLQELPADLMDLTLYDFSYYDYEYKNKNDDFLGLAKKMITYDKIIFCTPVYWYSMSALMKIFIDRFSDLVRVEKPVGRALAGKEMYALCCSSDDEEFEGFFMPFEKTAGYLDMIYKGNVHTWIEAGEISQKVEEKLSSFSRGIIGE